MVFCWGFKGQSINNTGFSTMVVSKAGGGAAIIWQGSTLTTLGQIEIHSTCGQVNFKLTSSTWQVEIF